MNKPAYLLAAGVLAVAMFSSPFARAQEAEHKDAPEKPKLDTPTKRPSEPRIIKTIYVNYFSDPTYLQDLVNTLRVTVEIARISMIPSENAIVISGTADQIAQSEKLITELDNARKKLNENLRLDFKVIESENGKKLNQRNFSLIARPMEQSTLRISARQPLSASEAGSDNKQLRQSNVGPAIKCNVRHVSERSVIAHIGWGLSNPGMLDSQDTKQENAFREFNSEMDIEFELGKPVIISSFDDPVSRRTYQIEATVTR